MAEFSHEILIKDRNMFQRLLSFAGSLFILIFDFGNFFRRDGDNAYSRISHSVNQCIELPSLVSIASDFL